MTRRFIYSIDAVFSIGSVIYGIPRQPPRQPPGMPRNPADRTADLDVVGSNPMTHLIRGLTPVRLSHFSHVRSPSTLGEYREKNPTAAAANPGTCRTAQGQAEGQAAAPTRPGRELTAEPRLRRGSFGDVLNSYCQRETGHSS
jgi:hypothetical protein